MRQDYEYILYRDILDGLGINNLNDGVPYFGTTQHGPFRRELLEKLPLVLGEWSLRVSEGWHDILILAETADEIVGGENTSANTIAAVLKVVPDAISRAKGKPGIDPNDIFFNFDYSPDLRQKYELVKAELIAAGYLQGLKLDVSSVQPDPF